MDKRTPLGHILLDSGEKPIYPTNDFFLNFMFDQQENWETLRLIVNIFFAEFNRQNPFAAVEPIKGEISIETQYLYFLHTTNRTKNQDFKIEEAPATTCTT